MGSEKGRDVYLAGIDEVTVLDVQQAILDYLAEHANKGVTAWELSRRPLELDRRAAMLALQTLQMTGRVQAWGLRPGGKMMWTVYVPVTKEKADGHGS